MSVLKRKAWFKLIEEWETGSQTQPLFCKEKQISLTTFGYYRSEYLRAKKAAQSNSTELTLLPVQLSSATSSTKARGQSAEVHSEIFIKTPSGFEVRCDRQDIEPLTRLLGLMR